MNILVIYNSRGGNTQTVAENIAERLTSHDVVVKSVIEVLPVDVREADVLFIGTWVHGLILFGVRPADAELWVPTLPLLDDKPVGLFCTYTFNPRDSLAQFEEMITEQDGYVVSQHAFHSGHLDEDIDLFIQETMEAVAIMDKA